MSQIEKNKAVIKRYFEAYNNKDEAILVEIIDPEYVDYGQSAYMGSPGKGVAGAKHDLENSLNKLDERGRGNGCIRSLPGSCGCILERIIDTKSNLDTPQTNKIISYRGISIYRIQNGKMVETWHVFDGLPMKLLST
jgi:hypothetical protein